jgi:hypothetical protein
MPVTSTPAFAQSVAVGTCQINPNDYTILKELFTAGENGSLIDFISVSSSETVARDVQFWITKNRGEFARGILTSTGTNVSNNDTVTIGSRVYTFQTTLTNVDGNVKIGASAAASLTNLINAITVNAGNRGIDYAESTTQHPQVTAATISSNSFLVMANEKGATGNSIATTETAVTLSFGGSTLSGGLDSALVDVLLCTFSVQANSGFISATGLISALDNMRFGSTSVPTGLQVLDSNGNKLLRLAAGEILRVKTLANVSANRSIYIRASGVNL